jgi:hypothetical protein
LRFDSSAEPASSRSALATQQIIERVSRYGWSFDERRADLLAECFTDDAVWSGDIAGERPVSTVRGRDAVVGWLSEFWPRQQDQRRHLMMSVSVTLKNETQASALSSLLLTSAKSSTLSLVLTSFYQFELERSRGIWRISSLFEGCDVPF